MSWKPLILIKYQYNYIAIHLMGIALNRHLSEGVYSNSLPRISVFFINMIDIHSWIDIPWYEWKYQILISDNRVKSLQRKALWRCWWIIRERLLKPWFTKSWHFQYWLSCWKSKTFSFHELVMLIKEWPCPEWMEVCHNDWNSKNNHPDNLRYDTHSSNWKDSYIHWRLKPIWMKWKFWDKHHLSKKVYCGWIIYNSIRDAERITWIDNSTISRCCRWIQKTAGGFIWKYL